MSKVRFAEYENDAASYRLSSNDGEVPLEPKVAELLTLLIAHRSRVVSRREIFDVLFAWKPGCNDCVIQTRRIAI